MGRHLFSTLLITDIAGKTGALSEHIGTELVKQFLTNLAVRATGSKLLTQRLMALEESVNFAKEQVTQIKLTVVVEKVKYAEFVKVPDGEGPLKGGWYVSWRTVEEELIIDFAQTTTTEGSPFLRELLGNEDTYNRTVRKLINEANRELGRRIASKLRDNLKPPPDAFDIP